MDMIYFSSECLIYKFSLYDIFLNDIQPERLVLRTKKKVILKKKWYKPNAIRVRDPCPEWINLTSHVPYGPYDKVLMLSGR